MQCQRSRTANQKAGVKSGATGWRLIWGLIDDSSLTKATLSDSIKMLFDVLVWGVSRHSLTACICTSWHVPSCFDSGDLKSDRSTGKSRIKYWLANSHECHTTLHRIPTLICLTTQGSSFFCPFHTQQNGRHTTASAAQDLDDHLFTTIWKGILWKGHLKGHN